MVSVIADPSLYHVVPGAPDNKKLAVSLDKVGADGIGFVVTTTLDLGPSHPVAVII